LPRRTFALTALDGAAQNRIFVKEAHWPISGEKRPWIHCLGWSMASPPVGYIRSLKPTNFRAGEGR